MTAEPARILVRATNWIGDAVMSLPALRAVRRRFPEAHIAVLAKPWVADLYAGESAVDRIILYVPPRWRAALALRRECFDLAVLLQNAFEAALVARVAGIPAVIGYNRDGRGFLLSQSIPTPKPGELPPHERFYYLELLRRAGLIDRLPSSDTIRLEGADAAQTRGRENLMARGIRMPVIGVSPGAAFGSAKRWLPERFAESAATLANEQHASVCLFGSSAERTLCDQVAALITGSPAYNFAGQTSLREFIDIAAACSLFLTNDSGAMHIASALGVPTVTVFGSTNHITTGPTGPLAAIVREPVDCSPCMLRECPIDHRCMTRVPASRVVAEAEKIYGHAR